jgi:hypothetical protein
MSTLKTVELTGKQTADELVTKPDRAVKDCSFVRATAAQT